MRNYFAALHAQYGDADTGFLPQSFHSHTKLKLKDSLLILARIGTKLGGTLDDQKGVLVERVAHWLNRVLDAGRSCKAPCAEEEPGDMDDFQREAFAARPALVEHTHEIGQVPETALVTAEQAESALGRTIATEIDVDFDDAVDPDTKEEEEKLAGYQVNPSGVNYECVSWQPDAPGAVSAEIFGWDGGRVVGPLTRKDFACTAEDVKGKLHNSLRVLVDGFKTELEGARAHGTAERSALDPTQRLVVDVIAEWAEQRVAWTNAHLSTRGPSTASQSVGLAGQSLPPRLQVLLLGTAGTGKTHTAKIAITEVRLQLGSYESVLTMAFSGVASANLGT